MTNHKEITQEVYRRKTLKKGEKLRQKSYTTEHGLQVLVTAGCLLLLSPCPGILYMKNSRIRMIAYEVDPWRDIWDKFHSQIHSYDRGELSRTQIKAKF